MDYITDFAKTLVAAIVDLWYTIWTTDIGKVSAGLCLAFFTAFVINRYLISPITGGVLNAGSDVAGKAVSKIKNNKVKKNKGKEG